MATEGRRVWKLEGSHGDHEESKASMAQAHRGEHHGGTEKAQLWQGSQDPAKAYTWQSGLPRSEFLEPQLSVKAGLAWGDDEGQGNSSTYIPRWEASGIWTTRMKGSDAPVESVNSVKELKDPAGPGSGDRRSSRQSELGNRGGCACRRALMGTGSISFATLWFPVGHGTGIQADIDVQKAISKGLRRGLEMGKSPWIAPSQGSWYRPSSPFDILRWRLYCLPDRLLFLPAQSQLMSLITADISPNTGSQGTKYRST